MADLAQELRNSLDALETSADQIRRGTGLASGYVEGMRRIRDQIRERLASDEARQLPAEIFQELSARWSGMQELLTNVLDQSPVVRRAREQLRAELATATEARIASRSAELDITRIETSISLASASRDPKRDTAPEIAKLTGRHYEKTKERDEAERVEQVARRNIDGIIASANREITGSIPRPGEEAHPDLRQMWIDVQGEFTERLAVLSGVEVTLADAKTDLQNAVDARANTGSHLRINEQVTWVSKLLTDLEEAKADYNVTQRELRNAQLRTQGARSERYQAEETWHLAQVGITTADVSDPIKDATEKWQAKYAANTQASRDEEVARSAVADTFARRQRLLEDLQVAVERMRVEDQGDPQIRAALERVPDLETVIQEWQQVDAQIATEWRPSEEASTAFVTSLRNRRDLVRNLAAPFVAATRDADRLGQLNSDELDQVIGQEYQATLSRYQEAQKVAQERLPLAGDARAQAEERVQHARAAVTRLDSELRFLHDERGRLASPDQFMSQRWQLLEQLRAAVPHVVPAPGQPVPEQLPPNVAQLLTNINWSRQSFENAHREVGGVAARYQQRLAVIDAEQKQIVKDYSKPVKAQDEQVYNNLYLPDQEIEKEIEREQALLDQDVVSSVAASVSSPTTAAKLRLEAASSQQDQLATVRGKWRSRLTLREAEVPAMREQVLALTKMVHQPTAAELDFKANRDWALRQVRRPAISDVARMRDALRRLDPAEARRQLNEATARLSPGRQLRAVVGDATRAVKSRLDAWRQRNDSSPPVPPRTNSVNGPGARSDAGSQGPGAVPSAPASAGHAQDGRTRRVKVAG